MEQTREMFGASSGVTTQASETKPDQYRKRAADTLERAAEKARYWGFRAPGGSNTTRLGEQAASGLDCASAYLRDHTAGEIASETRAWIRQNPGPVLACAAVFGFLVGAAMWSRGGRTRG
jgi:hypothetical protein